MNLHVGSDLMQEPEPEAPDEEDPGDPLDDVAPVLKVKLNNTIWARLDLTNYAGKDDVWVTVPLNFEKMKAGNNRITVDSNVYNTADFSSHSVDLYFTSSIKGDSAVSSDGMVYWEPISDRVCNIALELRDRETGGMDPTGGGNLRHRYAYGYRHLQRRGLSDHLQHAPHFLCGFSGPI